MGMRNEFEPIREREDVRDHVGCWIVAYGTRMVRDMIEAPDDDAARVRITTPFLNRHSDYVQVWVSVTDDGMIRIDDDGETIGNLFALGSGDGRGFKPTVNSAINAAACGVNRSEDDRLFVESRMNDADFTYKLNDLITAIIAVGALAHMALFVDRRKSPSAQ